MKRLGSMDDTSPEITKKVCEMFQSKTPIERLKIGCSMYETSKYLVTKYILENTPDISEEGLRQELFLRFYSSDFTPDQREKIVLHLGQPR